jgi:tetratricopeptide (TPR) repeat protein
MVSEHEGIREKALRLMREEDNFSTIEYLNQLADHVAVMDTYMELIKFYYWEEKNLPIVVMLSRAGIQEGLNIAASLEVNFPDQSQEIRGRARALAYNLASFAWPGWDESGIVVDDSDLAAGLDAAKVALRLVREMELDELRLSRAKWMLAAYYLATKDYEEAKQTFEEASEFARAAESNADVLLCEGFVALAKLLANPDDNRSRAKLDDVKMQIAKIEHGEDFINQLDTAYQVFSKISI